MQEEKAEVKHEPATPDRLSARSSAITNVPRNRGKQQTRSTRLPNLPVPCVLLLQMGLLLAGAVFLDYLTVASVPTVPVNVGFTTMVLPFDGVDGVTVNLDGVTVLPHMNSFVSIYMIENNSDSSFDDVVLTLGYDATILDPEPTATHATFNVKVGSLGQSSIKVVSVLMPLGYGNRAAPDTIDFILSTGRNTLTAGPLMAKDILKSFFSRHEVTIGMLSGQGQAKSSEVNALCSYFTDQPYVKTVAQTGILAEATTFSFDPYPVFGKLYVVDTPGVTELLEKFLDIDDAMRRLAIGDYASNYRTDTPYPDDGGASFARIVDVVLSPFMPATIGMDKSDGTFSMVEYVGKLAKGVAEQASSAQPAGRQTIIKPYVVLSEATAEEEVADSYRTKLASELAVNLSAVGSTRTYHDDRSRRDVQVDLSTHRLLVSIVRELHGGFDVERATAYDVVHDNLLGLALLIPCGAFTTLAAAVIAAVAYRRMA
eukprot:CAMPEP_0114611616 /NCGR_PEP_ID=MMETSP0168-20121206/4209_1 /TAXON_ID=95228 ORGANISM="Vannella sp., Strain DIVA3 517/6/12" /NCGR_SAMPLE_ID=MMETSP0168 /ASSEMBLY_ACC=CAM_ASM_000044 /LENGTH=484 /DNA_ID=CAMNT_0001822597 /DNA_START=99 /DNA_END=1553 /DNA_ORIENTATION=-